jgi:hypothetical protein
MWMDILKIVMENNLITKKNKYHSLDEFDKIVDRSENILWMQ